MRCSVLLCLFLALSVYTKCTNACLGPRSQHGLYFRGSDSRYLAPLADRNCWIVNYANNWDYRRCVSPFDMCSSLCTTHDDCRLIDDSGEIVQSYCFTFKESGMDYNGNYPAPSTVKVCGCQLDAHCRNGEVCDQALCKCSSTAQCGPGRKCSWLARAWNEVRYLGYGPGYTENHPWGQCECDITQGSLGCNGRGTCVDPIFGEDNIAHPLAFEVPKGSGHKPGFCQCANGYNGKFCEHDYARITQCSGNGEPLCDAFGGGKGGEAVVSPYTGRILNAFVCRNENLFTNPQTRGEKFCKCDAGWGPEYVGNVDSPLSNQPKCNQKLACVSPNSFQILGAVAGDGFCKCYGDFYDSKLNPSGGFVPQPGSCIGNCRQTICSGHGTCVPDPGSNVEYNSICRCDPGWTTASVTQTDNLAVPGFESKRYCNTPIDKNNFPTRPCGFFAEPSNDPSTNFCKVMPKWKYLLTPGQPASPFDPPTPPDSPSLLLINELTGLYTQTCGVSTNPLFPSAVCGGPSRGQCVSDGRNGNHCVCNNGWFGVACHVPMGPSQNSGNPALDNNLFINGAPCSGNGFISNPTFPYYSSGGYTQKASTCICRPNFFGNACQYRVLDCSSSANVRSYPLIQSLIPSIL